MGGFLCLLALRRFVCDRHHDGNIDWHWDGFSSDLALTTVMVDGHIHELVLLVSHTEAL